MKLIHTADLHIDAPMTGLRLTEQQREQRRREILGNFVRLSEFADREGAAAVLLTGDVFDAPVVSETARQTVLGTIRRFPEIQYFYLRGNHDEGFRLCPPEDIPENLVLFDDTWQSRRLSGTVVVTGRESSPARRRDPGDDFTELRDLLREEDFNILMLHVNTTEYKAPDPENRMLCNAETISLRTFGRLPVDYLALGHIHAYKEGMLENGGFFCYPGCLEGRGYDEPGEHGFVLLEIDEQSRELTRSQVLFAGRRILEAETDISGCMSSVEILERIRGTIRTLPLTRPAAREDFLHVTLVGEVSWEAEKDPGFLKQQLSEQYYQVRIEDRSCFRTDPAEYRYDPSLKGEFVRIAMAEDSIPPELREEVVRTGLRALLSEEF